MDLDLWAWPHGVVLDFRRPGKPPDNAFAESFNGRVRAECLNTHWLLSIDDVRSKIEAWRIDTRSVRIAPSAGAGLPINDVLLLTLGELILLRFYDLPAR